MACEVEGMSEDVKAVSSVNLTIDELDMLLEWWEAVAQFGDDATEEDERLLKKLKSARRVAC